MADTVETLRADLDALQAEFNNFKAQTAAVVDQHDNKPLPPSPLTTMMRTGPSITPVVTKPAT
jgi:hypothetical protein